jgi:hypothetical protein
LGNLKTSSRCGDGLIFCRAEAVTKRSEVSAGDGMRVAKDAAVAAMTGPPRPWSGKKS